jgi:hypothetical protein
VTPIVPPGRHTRTSSEAARSWSGANIAPIDEVTTSNSPSANGSASASASTHSSSSPRPAASRRPASSSEGVRSEATTCAPAAAAASATLPAPAATSSTRWPRRTPHAATSRGPNSAMPSRATFG